jgi:predicted secreted hydrolase
LQTSGERYELSLDLVLTRPYALHGPLGVCAVDMGPAGTSYFYSGTDLNGVGFLTMDGARQAVRASAWMDHRWGRWQSHRAFAGWDWFSLRLDDGSRVMLFDFRDEQCSVYPESGGTWIAADGTTQHLSGADYALNVLEQWTSPTTGGTYPVKWRLTMPGYGVQATVGATFPEQEMAIRVGPTYWQGSVAVDGTVQGVGYVEMTGYVPTAR